MASKGRVLVVEDNQDIREMMAECLGDSCTVSVAQDGTQALEMLTSQEFDAIVVDQELPGLSGTSLIGELRDRGIHVPTLMVSGAPNARRLAHEAHTDLMLKPFDVDRLEAKVEALLHETPSTERFTTLASAAPSCRESRFPHPEHH
jgi:DNA-binding response OmpR family regulator